MSVYYVPLLPQSHLQTIILLFCPLSVQLCFLKRCHFISLFPLLLSYKLLCYLDGLYFALLPHAHPNIVHNSNFSKNSNSSCTKFKCYNRISVRTLQWYVHKIFFHLQKDSEHYQSHNLCIKAYRGKEDMLEIGLHPQKMSVVRPCELEPTPYQAELLVSTELQIIPSR